MCPIMHILPMKSASITPGNTNKPIKEADDFPNSKAPNDCPLIVIGLLIPVGILMGRSVYKTTSTAAARSKPRDPDVAGWRAVSLLQRFVSSHGWSCSLSGFPTCGDMLGCCAYQTGKFDTRSL